MACEEDCALREVNAAKAIRGATQVARKVLDMGNDELVLAVRAYHRTDEARGPLGGLPSKGSWFPFLP